MPAVVLALICWVVAFTAVGMLPAPPRLEKPPAIKPAVTQLPQ